MVENTHLESLLNTAGCDTKDSPPTKWTVPKFSTIPSFSVIILDPGGQYHVRSIWVAGQRKCMISRELRVSQIYWIIPSLCMNHWWSYYWYSIVIPSKQQILWDRWLPAEDKVSWRKQFSGKSRGVDGRPAKLKCGKVPHFTLTSRTNFPYIFYKFTHFQFSSSPYISLKLRQL